jgi:anaerobic selenocysteine-containing dehydrogenase
MTTATSVETLVEERHQQATRKVVGICGICPGGCGVEIELVDGRIERLLPLKGHPVGIVCPRGAHAKEVVYSPDRLLYPLARVGAKGEGRFEQISWDAALDRIAERLLEIKLTSGPQAVMSYIGRGLFDSGLVEVFAPPGQNDFSSKSFLFPFGSPNNAGCNSVCQVAYGVIAAKSTFGIGMGDTYPDFDNARLIVVWGANPATDSPPINVPKILNAKRRGARVIAIDHMRSHAAEMAHQWIPIRSGTDGALALGMINVIIRERLYDEEFVRNWTVGFDELREYVASFTPEEVERITRVPASLVIETARAIATTKRTTLSMYTGLEYTDSGVQNLRAVFILFAITGNLDMPGGIMLRARRKSPYGRTDIAPPADVKPIGYDKYPLFCDLTRCAQFMEAPRAILHGDPYPIKALIIAGASIITGYPDPELWKRCLGALDLLVVTDRFMTADAQYADFVLPATTYFENKGYQKYPGYVQIRERVIEPRGESRPDYWIIVQLAKRLGYGELFPKDEDALIEFVLRDHPVGLEELRRHPEGMRFGKPEELRKYEKGMLRADQQPGFPTPSGKVEIASSLLAKHGFDALPKYTEPAEGPLASPDVAQEYPLVLNTGARIQSSFRSQHLNIPGLLGMQPAAQVLIHPQDAAARGIADNDPVQVRTRRGCVPFRACVTDVAMPGEVEVNVGGGGPIHANGWREANTNYLTDFNGRDPISGFPTYKALLCQVEKLSNTGGD